MVSETICHYRIVEKLGGGGELPISIQVSSRMLSVFGSDKVQPIVRQTVMLAWIVFALAVIALGQTKPTKPSANDGIWSGAVSD